MGLSRNGNNSHIQRPIYCRIALLLIWVQSVPCVPIRRGRKSLAHLGIENRGTGYLSKCNADQLSDSIATFSRSRPGFIYLKPSELVKSEDGQKFDKKKLVQNHLLQTASWIV
jgi:hypothetical protein